MVMPASWSGAMRTTPGLFQVLGGDLRPRPQLRVGIVWGVARAMLEVQTSRGLFQATR